MEHLVLVSGLTHQNLNSGSVGMVTVITGGVGEESGQEWFLGAHSFSGCSPDVLKTTLFAGSVLSPAREDSTRLVFFLCIKTFSEC